MYVHTCALLHLVTAPILRLRETASVSTILETDSSWLSSLPLLPFTSAVVLIGAGAPFCQLLVAAGQQDGLQQRFPPEPISLCHVRSYAHKLVWGAHFNELLSHTVSCRFWLIFFFLALWFMQWSHILYYYYYYYHTFLLIFKPRL